MEVWSFKTNSWKPYEGKTPRGVEWGDVIDQAKFDRIAKGG